MNGKRTLAQDSAKGLMIISVIFFHCYLVTFVNHSEALVNFNILIALFPFLLSAFFFYAGYNYTEKNRTFKENITRRAKQLLIPMVFAMVISTLLISPMELIFNHNDIAGTFKAISNAVLYGLMSEPLALMIGFPKSGGVIFELMLAFGLLWFLYALFICSIFFFLLVKFTNKKLSTLISVVSSLLILAFVIGQFVGTYLPFTVQCYPVILAIMLTAAYLKQSNFLNKEITSKKDIVFISINALIAEGLVVGLCLLCHYLFGAMTTGSLPGGQFDGQLKGFDAFISFAFGIFGTYFLHTACRLINHIPVVGKCLQWVGNHSAIFYLFHPVFLDLTRIVFFQKQIMWGQAQAFFLVGIVILMLTLVCLLMDFIIKKIREKKQPVEDEEKKEQKPESV